MTLASAPADRVVRINGINIAFQLQGEGPPLVLVMGYRLSSVAWPAKLLEALAKNFTVITFDNRGTGRTDKPLTGYALANMARDIAGLLDEIGVLVSEVGAHRVEARFHQGLEELVALVRGPCELRGHRRAGYPR